MKNLIIYILSLFVIFACQHKNNEQLSLDGIFDAKFKQLFSVNNKAELEQIKNSIEKIVDDLSVENSSYIADFKHLNKLFEAKLFSRAAKDPDSQFSYLLSKILANNRDYLVKKYQKVAPKCMVFDIIKDKEKLDIAFEKIKKKEFIYQNKTYKLADALKKWMVLKDFKNEEMAKEKLGEQLKEGICWGLRELANRAFCEDTNIDEANLALYLEHNFSLLLELQIEQNILSELLKSGDNKIVLAYNMSLQKEYGADQSISGYLPAVTLKNWLRNNILKKHNAPRAILLAFRAGSPHAVAAQITADKFRLIDNNFGILVFDDEETFLDELSKYIVLFYENTADPETVFAVKKCTK